MTIAIVIVGLLVGLSIAIYRSRRRTDDVGGPEPIRVIVPGARRPGYAPSSRPRRRR